MTEVVIIGAGGHGKVIADIIEKSGDRVVGFLDDNPPSSQILNYPMLGVTSDCEKYTDKKFIIAIGNNKIRQKIATQYKLNYYTAIHPNAVIGRDVVIGEGTCVMAGCVINVSTRIGKHCIINSGSVVEHDNILGDFVHLSPKAALCGTVCVGDCTHIGAGATIRNNTSITKNCIIGVGGAVVEDIMQEGTYCGVPAKRM